MFFVRGFSFTYYSNLKFQFLIFLLSIFASRSTSSSNVHGQMTQSLYVPSRRSADRDSTDEGGRFSSASGGRHSTSTSERQNKRSTSVYGLDKSGKEGNEG